MVNGFPIQTTREKKPVNPRALALVAAMLVAFTVLAASLYALQIRQGGYYRHLADGNRIRRVVVIPPRGVIYDRHGAQLVENVGGYSLAVVPADLPRSKAQRATVIDKLQKIVDIPLADLEQQIEQAQRAQPFQAKELKKGLTPEQAMILRERSAQLPGVQVVVAPERHYLQPTLVSHLIGYIGKLSPEEYASLRDHGYLLDDQIGKAGIEVSLESSLRGKPGVLVQETDVNGVGVRTLSEEPGFAGSNVYLTIDKGLQEYTARVLEEGMKAGREGRPVGPDGFLDPHREAFGPDHALTGAAVVMNPMTGEVLAMVSSPSYDINLFARGISQKDYEALDKDVRQPLINRPIYGEYAPGSTFKMVTSAAALQEGNIDRGSTVFCPGYLNYGGHIFRCWLGGGHGSQNVISALARSCDVFFYTMGDRLGDVTLARYMRDFGLGAKTGIEIGPERGGLAPDRTTVGPGQPWYPGTAVQMGIGQGPITVTPLQILNVANIIWNGGNVMRPTLVEQVVAASGVLERGLKPEVHHRVKVSPQNLATIRDGMRGGVTDAGGTSNQFRNFAPNGVPIQVAGKTGTAQYGDGSLTHAWYVGVAPVETPEVSAVVFVSNAGEGFWYSEPIVKQILTYYFQHREAIVSHAGAPAADPVTR